MARSIKSPSHHWVQTALAAPLHAVLEWYRISQERAALRDLPSHRLSDIGLTKREVEWELNQPFWKTARDI